MTQLEEHAGATIVHDGDRIAYASDAFLELTGLDTRDDAVGESLSAFVDASAHERLRTQFDRLRRGDVPVLGTTLTIRTPAETTHRVVAVSSLVSWDRKDRIGTTFVDVEEVTSASVLARHATDESPIGVTIADAAREDQPLIYANDEFLELTGYTREEVIGRNCRFLQGEHTQPEPVARMRSAIDAGEPVTVVLRNYRKDGTMFWNRVTIAPIEDDSGRVTHYLGYQEDVTESKIHEHEKTVFEAHADGTDQAMFVTDRAGTIEYVNPAFERMTGYTAAEAIGENPRILKSDEQDEGFYADLWETISAGDVWEAELTNRTKSGEQYRVEQTIVPITDDRGEITQFVAIERDITDERFVEQILDVMNRVLRHNVRTSVNVIDGYADMLEEEIGATEHRAAIRVIRERASALRKVSEQTNDIREVFRRRSEPTTLSVEQLVAFVDRCRRDHPDATIECRMDVDDELAVENGGLLELAIEEAIENAVVHSDRETPRVTVTITDSIDSSGVHIEIADDGPGVPESEWEVITVGEETPLLHSSGIGLWVIYWTVTALGGSVALDDNDPRGSVITFRIPARTA